MQEHYEIQFDRDEFHLVENVFDTEAYEIKRKILNLKKSIDSKSADEKIHDLSEIANLESKLYTFEDLLDQMRNPC